MIAVNETPDALGVWEARCKAHGLTITPSRRAILAAMLQGAGTGDAVAWLLAAQEHHAATSLNTVYRFLRDMEQRGLVDVQATPRARCRWRLRNLSPTIEADDMLRQLQAFLHGREVPGFATPMAPAETLSVAISSPDAPPAWHLLQRIAERLGYGLILRRMHSAY